MSQEELNIVLNDSKHNNNEDKTKQPLSKALNIAIASINKEYDSDYGTIYNDKYCSVNQCSLTTNSANHEFNDVNLEIFSNTPSITRDDS